MSSKLWKDFLKGFKDFGKNPLKLVNYKVSNLDDVWEKVTSALSKEEGLTQAGIDLATKRLSYAYHPDFHTLEKLTKKIQSLGAKIETIEEK